MSTPKNEAAAMLQALPDDSSFEDIQYHLYVLEKVNRGIQRAEAEGAFSHDDAKVRLGKWLTAWSGHPRQLKTSNPSRRTLRGIRYGMQRLSHLKS